VGIARAFAAEPHLVVCDEPVSAVDVSVQASILNLILDLQKQFSVALLFISHDLSVVQHISHHVGIMYLGELVEVGDVDQVFSPPYHPYTEALLSAVPTVDFSAIKDEIRLVGPVPSAKRPPPGCRFHTRCPRRIGKICEEQVPQAYEPVSGHRIRCHLYK
jgi:peptide/nickel transport system ATP-binding protein